MSWKTSSEIVDAARIEAAATVLKAYATLGGNPARYDVAKQAQDFLLEALAIPDDPIQPVIVHEVGAVLSLEGVRVHFGRIINELERLLPPEANRALGAHAAKPREEATIDAAIVMEIINRHCFTEPTPEYVNQ